MSIQTETPPPASKPPADRGTTEAATAYLDGLRGLAAAFVVVAHVILIYFDNKVNFPVRGLAVAFLFIISGFLIMRSLTLRSRKPGPHLPNFLADRVARILTPLVPVVFIVALLNATVISSRMGEDGLSTGFLALLGNVTLLLDYPAFQALSVAGIDVSSWRIRPYNTAEPFWTVAIEFWLYFAVGLMVFVTICREQIRTSWVVLFALVSLPVVVWNAADGPGKSLTIIWLLGGLAGYLVATMGRETRAARSESLWLWITGVGVAALAMRIFKMRFDPYDLQTAFLVITIFFGLFLRFNRAKSVPRLLARVAAFFASYSYSLYLVHNTVLVLVHEHVQGLPIGVTVAIAVVCAHVCALAVHHAFEKHHRKVGTWLRPRFNRILLRPATTSQPQAEPARPLTPVAPAQPVATAPTLPTPSEVIGGAVAAATAVAASLVPGDDKQDTPAGLGGGLMPQ